MAKEKILVTGAPGWLGNRLVELLVGEGADVRCLVLPSIDAVLLKKFGVEIAHGDITNKESLPAAFQNIHTVIHAAGIIHPEKIGDFYRINTEGTKNMLDAAVAAGVKKFIYISSNSAQGHCGRNSLMVEEAGCEPYASYGMSKFLAEQDVNRAHNDRGLNTTIVRPCWYYGPGQPDRQTKLMKMVLQGKAPVFGDGTNLRSMTYIDNLIDAIMLIMKKPAVSAGQTYWIADEQPYTTIEIYQTIAKTLSVPLKTRRLPAVASKFFGHADLLLQKIGIYNITMHVAGEMTQNIACSIKKAKAELGYAPKINLEEGMQRSVEWCRQSGSL